MPKVGAADSEICVKKCNKWQNLVLERTENTIKMIQKTFFRIEVKNSSEIRKASPAISDMQKIMIEGHKHIKLSHIL